MSYDRRWLEEAGSQDAHGRALWGLGVAIQTAPDPPIRDLSCQLFVNGVGCVQDFNSPRAWSFALVGIHHYLNVYSGDADIRKIRISVVESECWLRSSTDDGTI